MNTIHLKIFVLAVFSVVGLYPAGLLHADETSSEKAAAVVDTAKVKAKKVGRSIRDQTCETFNGKAECAGQKLEHKAKNAIDETRANLKETGNKID